MSDRTLVGSSFKLSPMNRRDASGTLIKIEEPDRSQYCVPPIATRGRFILSGISDVYIHDGQYGPKDKVALEFEIDKLATKGVDYLLGKRFTQSVGWPKNVADPKSHLGQFLGRLLQRPIREGEEINPDDFIGSSFVTATTLDDSGERKYPGISWDTIEPDKIILSPHVPASLTGINEPTPQLAGVATGGDDGDPFEGSEDDL